MQLRISFLSPCKSSNLWNMLLPLGFNYVGVITSWSWSWCPCKATLAITPERWWWSGEVPGDRGKERVPTLFKKGKKEDPRVYGAGDLTSVPGKAVLQVISKHIQDEKVLKSSQHWFTKWSSCLPYDEMMWVSWWRKGEQWTLSWLEQGFQQSPVTSYWNQ